MYKDEWNNVEWETKKVRSSLSVCRKNILGDTESFCSNVSLFNHVEACFLVRRGSRKKERTQMEMRWLTREKHIGQWCLAFLSPPSFTLRWTIKSCTLWVLPFSEKQVGHQPHIGLASTDLLFSSRIIINNIFEYFDSLFCFWFFLPSWLDACVFCAVVFPL